MKVFSNKVLTTITIVMAFLILVTPILAMQDDFTAGRLAGEQAGKSRTNGVAWMAIGCLGGLLGVIIAYLYEPSPPASLLLGKSPEYVAAFTDAYKDGAKSVQAKNAWTGCIVSTLLYVVYVVLVVAAAESSTE
ncbi:MAG: hypothetical protein ACPL7B_02560 [Candidatus Poribacteria bacterium]